MCTCVCNYTSSLSLLHEVRGNCKGSSMSAQARPIGGQAIELFWVTMLRLCYNHRLYENTKGEIILDPLVIMSNQTIVCAVLPL